MSARRVDTPWGVCRTTTQRRFVLLTQGLNGPVILKRSDKVATLERMRNSNFRHAHIFDLVTGEQVTR